MKDPGGKKVRSTLFNSGDVLQSRYRILCSLSSEGFGLAYLAEDLQRFNEHCVLKEFVPQFKGIDALEKAQELFEREVGILYRLQHPQISQFRQLLYCERDEGHLFLVWDYVVGETYHTLLNQRLKSNRCLNALINNELEEKACENFSRNIFPHHLMPASKNNASPNSDRLKSSTAKVSSVENMLPLRASVLENSATHIEHGWGTRPSVVANSNVLLPPLGHRDTATHIEQADVTSAFPPVKSTSDIHTAQTAKPYKKLHLFSEAEVKQLLIQVLPILEHIHSMGVIHRHICPDNLILRDRDKSIVLINFGCIKEVEIKIQSELSNATTPLSVTIIGKAGYAPPEQVERGIVYAHSDLYALAATAVVLLTGKEPQQLIDSNNYRWQWQSEITLSPKLEWILSTMLSPHPSDRFGSAAEVSKTIQDILINPTLPTQVNSERGFERQWLTQVVRAGNLFSKSSKKVTWTNNLLPKFLLFMSFVAVLALGGYLYLKIANPKPSDSASNSDSLENIQLKNRFSIQLLMGESPAFNNYIKSTDLSLFEDKPLRIPYRLVAVTIGQNLTQ